LRVEHAILQYLAVEADYNVSSHHAAIEAIRDTRTPGSSVGQIVQLYNQMFDHPKLAPSTRTFELVIAAFCQRDREIVSAIGGFTPRLKKRAVAIRARGDWHDHSSQQTELSEMESRELAALKKEDYFGPALRIYKALGSQADALRITVINSLLMAAVARGRIEVALSIFARLEKSPFDQPNATTYQTLIKMFGNDKDAEGVKEVFNAYLAARATGLPIASARDQSNSEPRISYQAVSTKHGHASTPDLIAFPADNSFYAKGDEAIWQAAIRGLFDAGDSVGGVELIERMIAALDQVGGPSAGYPTAITGLSTSAIVAGFLEQKDFSSARRWFDRMDNPAPNADGTTPVQPAAFYRIAFYSAADAGSPESLNHIFRSWLARTNSNSINVRISEAITAIDYSLAAIYDTTDVKAANDIMDSIIDVKDRFLAAAREGRIYGLEESFYFSSGSSTRLILGLAHLGRFDEACEMYIQMVDDCVASGVLEPTELNPYRSVEKWIQGFTSDSFAAILGLSKKAPGAGGPNYVFTGGRRSGIHAVTTTVAKVKELLDVTKRDLPRWTGPVIAESYVLEKKALDGDVAKLELSANQWLIVLEAAASVAADEQRGTTPTFAFPGFEVIVDDFKAAGMEFEETADLQLLAQHLSASMDGNRIVAVLHLISPAVGKKLAQGVNNLKDLAKPVIAKPVIPFSQARSPTTPTKLESTPSLDFAKIRPTDPAASLAEDAFTTLPTPPATPPTYFNDLAPAPPAQSVTIDLQLSNDVGQLVNINADAAYDMAMSAAQTSGLYAHPEVLSRLVEQLGRNGSTDKVREIYLLAYAALPVFASDPTAQSVMWVMLEDRMIIALCQVGALTEVAIHRKRLIDAGSAPSADGYAAMILNMQETTDDATVALTYFEESQRLNVAPNVFLFNTLISKLSRARRASDALAYFEFMKNCGLQPSSITYGAIINACCKTGDDKTADFLFQEMTASPGFRPRVPPYNTMIQFYTQTKPDRERALYYYDQLRQAGVKPTSHTYKLLLDAYGSIGEPDAASMSEIFAQLAADKNVDVTVTGAHWASLINAWGCVQKDLDHAVEIFNQIAHHPTTIASKSALPDAVVYESLLNAFLANHRPDLCSKYLLEMKARGIRSTAYIANTLIKVRFFSFFFFFFPFFSDGG
jgi:pentatricopeptide repeat protein